MSEDPKHLPATTTPDSSHPKIQRQRLLWVAIVLLLLGLVGLSVITALQWQQRQALEQRISQLANSVNSVTSQRQSIDSQIRDRLSRLDSVQGRQVESQQELERRVDQAARSLLQMGNRTRNDWLLAEAEYLIRIANQRLRMERDISGALTLLQDADKVLKEADDMGVYPVRQELAEDIQALKSIEDIDRVGLYLQLEAAIDRIDQLSQANLAASTPLDAAAQTGSLASAEADGALAQAWQSAKQTLSQVVTIRRLDEPVKPLLSPRQVAYANLNLRLMLEEAEMALLSADPVLYKSALNKAIEWVDQWYDESSVTARGLQQTLQSLAQRNIRPELPDISESLNLLKARINGQAGPDAGASGNQPPQNNQGSQPQS